MQVMVARIRYLLLIYIISIIILIFAILSNQRSYQDAWILQDIFIPAMIYILTFSVVAAMIDDVRILVIICASFLIILNTIPNLKYQLFYGTYDSAGHYGFAKNLLSLGFVPTTGVYASTYSDFPGMHIIIDSISLITSIDVNGSIKFFSSIIYGVIPLLVYLVTNRVFNKNIRKNIIIVSSLPILMSYIITGTTLGALLFCFFFYLLFLKNFLKENNRKYSLILTFVGLGLLFSHAVTMISCILFLYIMLILMRIIKFVIKTSSYSISHRKVIGILIMLSVLLISWLMFKASFVFKILIESVEKVFTGSVTKTPIPQRFFEIPLLEQLKILTLKYIKDAVILILSFAGLLVLLKRFKYKYNYLFNTFFLPLICLLGAILLFLALQFAIGFGEIEYRRFIDYALLFSPFFAGIFMWHINGYFKTSFRKEWLSRLFTALIIFLGISLSMIQIFPYQPLVPRANVLSKNLPENEYIAYFGMVNTIYQEKMIIFAERFSSKDVNIASDIVTRWQIMGFASVAFSSKHAWKNPLAPDFNIKNEQRWLILLHYSGRSGPLAEKVEYRTREIIDNLRSTLGNIIYDNGESFIISR
jgi:hypothetical protein